MPTTPKPPLMLVRVRSGRIHRARYVLGTIPPVWRQACDGRKVAGEVADEGAVPTCGRCLAEHEAAAAGVPIRRAGRKATRPAPSTIEVPLGTRAHAHAVADVVIGDTLADYPTGSSVAVLDDPWRLVLSSDAAPTVGEARARLTLTYARVATDASTFVELPEKRRNGRPGMPERLAALAAARKAGHITGWKVDGGADGLPVWHVPEWCAGPDDRLLNHVVDARLRAIPKPPKAVETEAAAS
jgi:hypothetical protein